MGKITTKKRILFSFRGQVTINGQIMSEKPGIFCAQNGQKLWVFGQPEGEESCSCARTQEGNGQPEQPAPGTCVEDEALYDWAKKKLSEWILTFV